MGKNSKCKGPEAGGPADSQNSAAPAEGTGKAGPEVREVTHRRGRPQGPGGRSQGCGVYSGRWEATAGSQQQWYFLKLTTVFTFHSSSLYKHCLKVLPGTYFHSEGLPGTTAGAVLKSEAGAAKSASHGSQATTRPSPVSADRRVDWHASGNFTPGIQHLHTDFSLVKVLSNVSQLKTKTNLH